MRGWTHGFAAAALVGVLAGCGQGDDAAAAAPPGTGGTGRGPRGGAEAALPVKAEPVARGEITSYVETHARLEAERWVEVVSRVQGLAEGLYCEEGDVVHAGQVLVTLGKDELLLSQEQAKVALQQAESSFVRTQALHERRMISQQDFENARNQMENTRVALQEVELRLEYADVRAPIDGVVMERQVELGDLVRGNQVVFAVADLEPLQARIRVPEKRMGQVRVGQEARVTVDPVPDRIFAGAVRMISPGVDPASGTVKVTLDVPAAGGLLKPGMFATVRIVTDRRPHALIIPKKALVLETDEDDVFAVRDGRAQRLRVELGYTDGDRVEIASGLTDADRVITVGHEGLKDGAAVRVVGAGEEVTPAAAAAPPAAAGGPATRGG